MKMTGIIFSNIYDSYLGELTKHRTLASLPFGGRYRLVDFVLSNMSNSGIVDVGIITKYNYQSLMDHLGSCEEWDLNRKNGRVFVLPPYGTGQTNVYKGKLEALAGAATFIERTNAKYVLLSDSNIICNIDFDVVLREHVNSGASVTMIGHKGGEHDPDAIGKFIAVRNDDGEIVDMLANHTYSTSDLIGMGMFIVNTDVLLHEVSEAVSHGRYHLERDFIQRCFLEGNLTVNAYEFKHTALTCRDTTSYFKNNLRLLEDEVRRDIFDLSSPIYTKVRDEVPTYYDKEANVSDCLVADGCRIEGSAMNSVIFRNVTIEKGAKVENSILMQGTTVRAGACIKNTILDKDVEITHDQTLVGSDEIPMIVQKGFKV